MNIHEYQAKALFEKFGVPVPKGTTARSEEEFVTALAELPEGPTMVKIPDPCTGGRGKGSFTNGFKGGVKFCKTKADAREMAAQRMINNTLVTVQTGPAGRKVQTIYFTVASDIKKEYYLAILLDRASSRPVIVASTEGGVEIETVAHNSPEKIHKIFVDPAYGLADYQIRQLIYALGFNPVEAKNASKLIRSLWTAYWETDAAMIEVNPLITTPTDQVLALDAKVSFDDNALFRHPEIVALRDLNEEDPKEIAASQHSLSYIALDGNIACLVNGAGLAMKHDGHHQALWWQSRQLPRCRRRRLEGPSDCGIQDHPGRPEREGDLRQYFRRHYGLQRDCQWHRGCGQRSRPQAPARRPSRRQQRRRRQSHSGLQRPHDRVRRHDGRRGK